MSKQSDPWSGLDTFWLWFQIIVLILLALVIAAGLFQHFF